MKISLGLPTNRGFQPKTLKCLLELVTNTKHEWHMIVSTNGYTIAENRNYITVQALNNKSDYLLMIDDDMVFPSDTLDRLLANKKDICGVAYHSREKEGDIMAIAEVSEKKYIDLENNKDPKFKKLFKCYAVGTGVILIKCDIFYKIERPWFDFEWHPTGQCKDGEDWVFCKKAKKAGYEVWLDPTIKIGHLGEIIY